MNRLLCLLALSVTLNLIPTLAAEPAKGKSPGDSAADAFFKQRDDKEAALTAARIGQLQAAGLNFLTNYPTHARAGSVINALAGFAGTIKDKQLAAMRDYWVSQLNYEIVNRRTKFDVPDELRLVLASLEAAIAGNEMKAVGSRDRLESFRGKIDLLAAMEGSGRFLAGHERDYVHVLLGASPKLAEAHANKLLASSDKKVVAMARDELQLMEMRKQPLGLKFTALDGREVDVAKLRGKVLYFIFWSMANEASLKELAELKDFYKPYQKLGVEIITVTHDTDREAVAKFVKDKRHLWPVLCDGEGSKGEFSASLNARTLPASALFNQQGMFVATGVRSNRLEPEVIKLGIKQQK